MKRVYLTGIPLVGKTTLLRKISEKQEDIETISYSKILAEHMSKKTGMELGPDNLRQLSAQIICPEDIHCVDEQIIDLMNQIGERKHIVVDSHAVTYENYGFRTTPFLENILKKMNFDFLISLFDDSEIIYQRSLADTTGRKQITKENIILATHLQNALLLEYGNILGKSVYYLDMKKGSDYISEFIIKLLNK